MVWSDGAGAAIRLLVSYELDWYTHCGGLSGRPFSKQDTEDRMSGIAAGSPARRHRRRRLRRREALWFWVFVSPWILGFLIFQFGPILTAAYFSLSDLTDLDTSQLPHLVGFTEYNKLFTSLGFLSFRDSIRATVIYVALSVPVKLVVALLVAQLLNQRIPLVRLMRTLYYMPTVVAGAAAALLWITLLQSDGGIVNVALSKVGLPPVYWLGTPNSAMLSMIVYSTWYMGTAMVVLLAALQGVPTELNEAAAIDGAGALRRFWHITLPMISPAILFLTVIGVIGSLQEFVAPALLTSGGAPMDSTLLMGYYLYQVAFEYTFPYHGAVAAAIAMVMFVAALVISGLIFLGARRFIYYAGDTAGERR
jgi:multiple sugar transport system permease protein